MIPEDDNIFLYFSLFISEQFIEVDYFIYVDVRIYLMKVSNLNINGFSFLNKKRGASKRSVLFRLSWLL